MVEPTNLKPRFLRSLLMRSESGVVAGHVGLGFPAVHDGFAIHIAPDERIEASELAGHVQKQLRVGYGRVDLKAVAHDPSLAMSSSTLASS